MGAYLILTHFFAKGLKPVCESYFIGPFLVSRAAAKGRDHARVSTLFVVA